MRIFRSFVFPSLVFVLLQALSVHAADINPLGLPKLTGYVEDFSNVLSPTDLAGLRQMAGDYEAKTTVQMAAVLIPNRGGNELFDIGMKVFRDNKLGQKGKNNGILLVIATEEKKIRIITGYGLEGDIPDVLASDFIEKSIRPFVNEGKFGEAVRIFFERTTKAIGTDEGKKAQEANDQEGILITSGLAFIFGLVFSFNIFFLIFAAIFFLIASFSVGSIGPVIGFLVGMIITLVLAFRLGGESFRKTFFEMPKNSGRGGG